MKRISFEIESIESGAYYTAAEVLLIGLRHIDEHRMSYPLGLTPEQWFDEVVPELIWFCEFVRNGSDYQQERGAVERAAAARILLSEHFTDIWC